MRGTALGARSHVRAGGQTTGSQEGAQAGSRGGAQAGRRRRPTEGRSFLARLPLRGHRRPRRIWWRRSPRAGGELAETWEVGSPNRHNNRRSPEAKAHEDRGPEGKTPAHRSDTRSGRARRHESAARAPGKTQGTSASPKKPVETGFGDGFQAQAGQTARVWPRPAAQGTPRRPWDEDPGGPRAPGTCRGRIRGRRRPGQAAEPPNLAPRFGSLAKTRQYVRPVRPATPAAKPLREAFPGVTHVG